MRATDEEDIVRRYKRGVEVSILAQLNACRICDIVEVLRKNNIPTEGIKTRKKYVKGHTKKTRCVETGEIFCSASAAGDSVNIEASYIVSAISKNKPAGGCHWEYVED